MDRVPELNRAHLPSSIPQKKEASARALASLFVCTQDDQRTCFLVELDAVWRSPSCRTGVGLELMCAGRAEIAAATRAIVTRADIPQISVAVDAPCMPEFVRSQLTAGIAGEPIHSRI